MTSDEEIIRVDDYTIKVNGHLVTADWVQEEKIRRMSPEQRKNFLIIMGHISED